MIRFLAALVVAVGLASPAGATVYYVSPTGSNNNSGLTTALPFATIQKGVDVAVAGDVINVMPGSFRPAANLNGNVGVFVSKSGTVSAPITIQASDPTNHPILDMSLFTAPSGSNITGIYSTGSYLVFRHLNVINTQQTAGAFGNGMQVVGGHDVLIDGMVVNNNAGVGIRVSGSGMSNITIQNSDIFNSYNTNPGEADGVEFINMDSTSTGMKIVGSRINFAEDDGIDLWGLEAPATLDHIMVSHAGFTPAGNLAGAGDLGTGVKLGLNNTGPVHLIHNNIACGNNVSGFNINEGQGPQQIYNNLAFNNGNTEFGFWSGGSILHNNVAYDSVLGQADVNVTVVASDTFNNWRIPVTVTPVDFVDLTCANLFSAARNSDDSLPAIVLNVGKPLSSSRTIDRGLNVGLPFSGTAPDLGPYEFAAVIDYVGDAKTQQAAIAAQVAQIGSTLTTLGTAWAYDATARNAGGLVVEPRGPAQAVPAATIAGTAASLQAAWAAAAAANTTLATDLTNISSVKTQLTDARSQQTAITNALSNIQTQITSLSGTTTYTPGLRDANGRVVLARDPSLVAPTWQVQAVQALLSTQRGNANTAGTTLAADLAVLP